MEHKVLNECDSVEREKWWVDEEFVKRNDSYKERAEIGLKKSDEHKAKIAKRVGKSFSIESKEKIRNSLKGRKGRKLSEETKRKMSESKKKKRMEVK